MLSRIDDVMMMNLFVLQRVRELSLFNSVFTAITTKSNSNLQKNIIIISHLFGFRRVLKAWRRLPWMILQTKTKSVHGKWLSEGKWRGTRKLKVHKLCKEIELLDATHIKINIFIKKFTEILNAIKPKSSSYSIPVRDRNYTCILRPKNTIQNFSLKSYFQQNL